MKLLDRQRLAHDAHTAEDAAIRYGDSLAHDRFEDVRFRNECKDILFTKVAEVNGVTEDDVRRSVDTRPLGFDLFVELSFFVLYYWFIAGRVTWRIRGLYPEKLTPAALPIVALTSLIISALALPLGEVWTGAMETIRIGNGHISYRLSRIPWKHHRLGIFLAGVIFFWVLVGLEYRFKLNGETTIALNLSNSAPELKVGR